MLAGMSLQPCNPTFIQARNAILQAEKNYYKGAYACLIWRAFAKRGLGVDAKQSGFVNGFAVPSACNTQFFADLNEEL
jgi:extracellular elastinolytic metalloproteinase